MSVLLVVDDEPHVVRTLAINLRTRDCDVETAGQRGAAHPDLAAAIGGPGAHAWPSGLTAGPAEGVWGPGYGRESNHLRVYANQHRRRLEPDPARPHHLLTDPGQGHRLVAESRSAR